MMEQIKQEARAAAASVAHVAVDVVVRRRNTSCTRNARPSWNSASSPGRSIRSTR